MTSTVLQTTTLSTSTTSSTTTSASTFYNFYSDYYRYQLSHTWTYLARWLHLLHVALDIGPHKRWWGLFSLSWKDNAKSRLSVGCGLSWAFSHCLLMSVAFCLQLANQSREAKAGHWLAGVMHSSAASHGWSPSDHNSLVFNDKARLKSALRGLTFLPPNPQLKLLPLLIRLLTLLLLLYFLILVV